MTTSSIPNSIALGRSGASIAIEQTDMRSHSGSDMATTPPAGAGRRHQATAALAGRGGVLHAVARHDHPEHRRAGHRPGDGRDAAQREVGAGELHAEPRRLHSRSAAGWPTGSARARVFASAIGLFTLGSVLCGLSTSIEMLVACRVLQGVGGAMMMPVGRMTLARTYDKADLVRAMSFVAIPSLVGPMVGPVAGGADRHLSALERGLLRQHSRRPARPLLRPPLSARLSRAEDPSARRRRAWCCSAAASRCCPTCSRSSATTR